MGEPLAKGANGEGRNPDGTFAPGWKGGPGNPVAKKTAEYRHAVYEAVGIDQLKAIIKTLIDNALAGDIAAAKEILDRVLGKPKQGVEVENLPELLTETIRLINGPVPKEGASAGDDARA